MMRSEKTGKRTSAEGRSYSTFSRSPLFYSSSRNTLDRCCKEGHETEQPVMNTASVMSHLTHIECHILKGDVYV